MVTGIEMLMKATGVDPKAIVADFTQLKDGVLKTLDDLDKRIGNIEKTQATIVEKLDTFGNSSLKLESTIFTAFKELRDELGADVLHERIMEIKTYTEELWKVKQLPPQNPQSQSPTVQQVPPQVQT